MLKVANFTNHTIEVFGQAVKPQSSFNCPEEKFSPAMQKMTAGGAFVVEVVGEQSQPVEPAPNTGTTEPAVQAPTPRQQMILTAIASLGDEDKTVDGKPKVDAINAALPEGAEPVTSEERDAIVGAAETASVPATQPIAPPTAPVVPG